jgi:hypothetical protein
MMAQFWARYKGAFITTAVIVVVLVLFLITRTQEGDYSLKYAGGDLGVADIGRGNTYARYLERYAGVPPGTAAIPIDIFSYTDAGALGVSVLAGFEGEARALRTEEDGYVEYTLHLDRAGLYNLYLEYFPVSARGIAIERNLLINGETPFLGAEQLTFLRVWGDAAVSSPGNSVGGGG